MRQMLKLLIALWAVVCFGSIALAQQGPIALCKNVTVEADANCSAMASIDDGSYDPGGDPVTVVQEPAGPYELGETLVKLIVTATSGLADTCEATVTVIDLTPPLVTCPADIVVNNDPGQCGANVSFDITATDNCSIASPLGKQRASFFPVGITTISPVVVDGSGNEGTCSFRITVIDAEKPVVVCPQDIMRSTDPGACGAVVEFAASATDNCPGVKMTVNPPSGSFFPVGQTTVWALATDASGNADSCSFTVTISDLVKPVIACPSPMTLNNDPGQCGAIVYYDVTATDNCDANPMVVVEPPSGAYWPVGLGQAMAIATDAAGNADTCIFSVEVKDVEPPQVLCPIDIYVPNEPGQCGAQVFFDVQATDNCVLLPPAVNVSHFSGTFFPIGQTVVMAIATDVAGNADTCTFNVTVTDIEAPHVICPADIEVISGPGQCGAVVDFAVDGWDNCPIGLVVVADPPSGSVFPVGIIPVTMIAVDASGKADTCDFKVTVKDLEAPSITCPDDIVETVNPGDTGKVVTFTATATDNCPDVTVWTEPASGSFFPLGTTLVNATARDASGLESQCSFTVEVKVADQFDFALEATPDTLYATEGISDSLLYYVDVTSIGGYWGWVALSVQGVPTGTVLEFGTGTVNPPAQTTLGGHTGVNTPAGTYELTIWGVEPPKKYGPHSTTVYLVVNPCTATPIPAVSQDLFTHQVEEGQNVPSDSVFVTNDAICGSLNWLASSDQPWVWADPINGVVQAGEIPGSMLHLVYNTSALAPGNYVAHIAIDRMPPRFIPGNPPPHAEITVNLKVTQKPVAYCVTGTIIDPGHNPIANSTVELYAGYPPSGMPIAVTTSGVDGSYKLCLPPIARVGNTVRAYKSGYYPDFTEAILPATDVILTLRPNGGNVTPTYEWIDLYCKFNALFEGEPLLPGSVVEAYDPQGVLCGQWYVTQPGTYGFMAVYIDDPYTPSIDEGAVPGDLITVKANGFDVTLVNGPIHWTQNGDRIEACFDVTPVPPYHCLVLEPGWNLVSWNVDTPNDSIQIIAADVMDNVDVILGFEQGAVTYDPMLPQFSSLLFADHLHGFWFRMNAEDTLCVEGPVVPASTPINLETNWNLVSYLPLVPYTVPVALNSIFSNVLVVLGYDQGAQIYDPAYPQFTNLDEMRRDFGYWIKMSQMATLTYPEPGPLFAKVSSGVRGSEIDSRVAVSNTWISLYGLDIRLNGATLPVGTVIEAYDASGALVGETVVRSAGKFGFMPVYGAEAISGDIVNKSAGSVITLKVNGEVADQAITWTENGDRIRVNELSTAGKKSGLPVQFSLNQNYPNPFNPETSIEYVVAQGSHVELAIYNILGDKIKTLVSGYQAAGSYIVKWHADTDNGSSVASGVYFYKLTAGDYTDTKKMTLMK